MSNLLKNALPAGICLFAVTIAMYIYQIFTGIRTEVLVTMASIAIIAVGFIALFRMCRPFNWFKSMMYIVCLSISITCIVCMPELFKYVTISYTDWLFLIVVCQASYPLYVVLNKLFELGNADEKSKQYANSVYK